MHVFSRIINERTRRGHTSYISYTMVSWSLPHASTNLLSTPKQTFWTWKDSYRLTASQEHSLWHVLYLVLQVYLHTSQTIATNSSQLGQEIPLLPGPVYVIPLPGSATLEGMGKISVRALRLDVVVLPCLAMTSVTLLVAMELMKRK